MKNKFLLILLSMIIVCGCLMFYNFNKHAVVSQKLRTASLRTAKISITQKYIISTTNNTPAKYIIEAKENTKNKIFIVNSIDVFVNLEIYKIYIVKIEMRKNLADTLSRDALVDINKVKECIVSINEIKNEKTNN